MPQAALPKSLMLLSGLVVAATLLLPVAAGACDGAPQQSAVPSGPQQPSPQQTASGIADEASTGHAKAWAVMAAVPQGASAKTGAAAGFSTRNNLLGSATAVAPPALTAQLAVMPDATR